MSGVMEFLRGLRQEESKRIWPATTKRNAPTNWIPDLVHTQSWYKDDVSNRLKMAREDPICYALTFGFAGNCWDDWFKFVDPNDPEKEIMLDVQEDMRKMEAKKFFTLAHGYERAIGWCWLWIGPEDTSYRVDGLTLPARVANLDVLTPEFTKVIEWDDIGAPKVLEMTILTNKGKVTRERNQIPINADECILFRTREFDRSHEGLPASFHVWDSLVGLNLIIYAIVSYGAKMGLGALVAPVKGTLTKEQHDALEEMMIDLSVTRVGMYSTRDIEDIKYIGAQGSTIAFDKYIDVLLGRVAAGARYPKDVLLGVSAGAITGSEVNSKALYAAIQGEQEKMEVYVREFVRRLRPNGTPEYEIEWNVRYAHDELEKAQIRELNARAELSEKQAEEGDIRIAWGGEPGQEAKPKKAGNPAGQQ